VSARDGGKKEVALQQRLLADHVFTWLVIRGHLCFARMEKKKTGLPWRGVLHRGFWSSGRQSFQETSGVLSLHFVIMHFLFGWHVFSPSLYHTHGEGGRKPLFHHPLLFMTFLDVYFLSSLRCHIWHSLECQGQGVEMLMEEKDNEVFFFWLQRWIGATLHVYDDEKGFI